MAGDSSDTTANSIDENFSMSELAPRKLFDSKDTIVNIADEILDNSKLAQNSFGTPVILRRGNMDSRWVSSQQKICNFSILKLFSEEKSRASHPT